MGVGRELAVPSREHQGWWALVPSLTAQLAFWYEVLRQLLLAWRYYLYVRLKMVKDFKPLSQVAMGWNVVLVAALASLQFTCHVPREE